MQTAEIILYLFVVLVLAGVGFVMFQQYMALKDQPQAAGPKKVAKKGRKASKKKGYWGLE